MARTKFEDDQAPDGRWIAPAKTLNAITIRFAALIVLWHGLDWIGHYVHWVWMGIIF